MRLSGRLCLLVAAFVLNSSYAFDIEKDLVFRLYTREDPVMYHALKVSGSPSIAETPFNPNRPTRIFVHGFKSKAKVITRYTDAYLKLGDFNFIAVDWIEGASTFNYYLARGRVGPVSSNAFTKAKDQMNLCKSIFICRSLRSWQN